MIYKLSAKKIRHNKILFPDGINVNFYKIINKNTIEVRTYEKGVEALMLSCVSGSFACAYHFCKRTNTQNEINIMNPGGNFLCSFKNNKKVNSLDSYLNEIEFLKNSNSIQSTGEIEYQDRYEIEP